MWAAANGHLDCIDELLSTPEGLASMSVVGEGGATALTVAGRRRQLEAAVTLLRHGYGTKSLSLRREPKTPTACANTHTRPSERVSEPSDARVSTLQPAPSRPLSNAWSKTKSRSTRPDSVRNPPSALSDSESRLASPHGYDARGYDRPRFADSSLSGLPSLYPQVRGGQRRLSEEGGGMRAVFAFGSAARGQAQGGGGRERRGGRRRRRGAGGAHAVGGGGGRGGPRHAGAPLCEFALLGGEFAAPEANSPPPAAAERLRPSRT
eukprot:817346-Prorocentrum_minimum.AAC.3